MEKIVFVRNGGFQVKSSKLNSKALNGNQKKKKSLKIRREI
jgi:hypothetical protein